MSVSAIPVVYGAKIGSYDPLTCILDELNIIKRKIHGTLPGIATTLGGCATRALDDDVAVLIVQHAFVLDLAGLGVVDDAREHC